MDPAFQALHLIHSQRRFRTIGNLANATALHDRLVVLHHTALQGNESEVFSIANRLQAIGLSPGPA
jgi:hypothetical protein